jgi:hypothetical protein
MDGYSVQEAASVLGVAEGRVWELLARGVLLGTPEGDSMRVFLKAQPGPIAAASAREEAPRTNGNGGSHGPTPEASAFRELLTEFRNLTERYGQALLALGEARGEVAGLRSRVDQLETRLDLRLPPPIEAAPVAWDSLSVPASTPAPEGAVPPPAKAPRPSRHAQRPRKARSSREAVQGFADALARAQDPNPPELAEGRVEPEAEPEESAEPITTTAEEPLEPMAAAEAAETAEQVAADEVAADEAAVDTEEVLSAAASVEAPIEDVAVDEAAAGPSTAEVEPPTYSAAVVEPDWFADGDFAWLDAAEMEASPPPEAGAATPGATEPGPEAAVDEPEAAVAEPEAAVAEPEATSSEPVAVAAEPEAAEPEPVAMPEPQIQAEPLREPEPAREPEPLPDFKAEADFAPWQPPEPPVPQVRAEPEPPTRSSAVAVDVVEEEVMWLGGDREPSAIMQDEPRQEQRAEAAGWPAVDVPPPVDVPRPPLAMTEDELARLALDEGWDEAEVAAIRAMITPPPTARVDLPGAGELRQAMAALEAVPVQVDPSYDVSRQWAKPTPGDDEPPRRDDWAFGAEPPPPPAPVIRPPNDVTSALRRAVADTGWLRRRQGPAAAAYRRLRRLFPG